MRGGRGGRRTVSFFGGAPPTTLSKIERMSVVYLSLATRTNPIMTTKLSALVGVDRGFRPYAMVIVICVLVSVGWRCWVTRQG